MKTLVLGMFLFAGAIATAQSPRLVTQAEYDRTGGSSC